MRVRVEIQSHVETRLIGFVIVESKCPTRAAHCWETGRHTSNFPAKFPLSLFQVLTFPKRSAQSRSSYHVYIEQTGSAI